MKGEYECYEYYELFRKTQQIGRFFLQLSAHARGKCFQIFLLPEGVNAVETTIYGVKDAVEIYGVVSGDPGWTAVYGWKHEGKWQDDFNLLVVQKMQDRDKEKDKEREKNKLKKEAETFLENNRIDRLLRSYR